MAPRNFTIGDNPPGMENWRSGKIALVIGSVRYYGPTPNHDCDGGSRMDHRRFIGTCLLGILLATWELASAQQPRRVLYATLGDTNLGLFIADGDGTHERALLRLDSSDYNGSFSADDRWIIFTSERN